MRENSVPATIQSPGSLRFWLALTLTGVLTGLSAIALALLLEFVQRVAWGAGPDDFLSAVSRVSPAHRVAVLLLAGLLTVTAQLLIRRVSSANGIDTTTAIWFYAGRLPVLRTLASAAVSLVGVGLGVSLGREGAPQQFGAAMGNVLCDRLRLPDEQRRLVVACGAGGGMGAAYSVTLGGALYSLEVFRGVLALRFVLPALFTAVIATATSFIVLPDVTTYTVPDLPHTAVVIGAAAIIAPVVGIAAAGFVRVVAWAERSKPHGSMRFFLPFVATGLLGVLAIWLPQLPGNGRDLAQLAFRGDLDTAFASVLLLTKTAVVLLCIRSGIPGGLFTPSLTIGALAGSVMGSALASLDIGVTPQAASLLGATAMVAATTQGPVSTIVLIMELTGRNRSLLIPVAFAVAVATLVARSIEQRSIYEARLSAEEVQERLRIRQLS
jgi:H+/Cl- antiporter ClcA